MAGFVCFLGFFGHGIRIWGCVELKRASIMYIDTTERIGLVSLKGVDIWGRAYLAITWPFF